MTTLSSSYKAKFIKHYLSIAATLTGKKPALLDYEWAQEAIDIAQKDCTTFLDQSEEILAKLANAPYFYRAEQAGEDFWLTRNGHGIGFWSRGLESAGETLSQIAQNMHGCDTYIGDDGKVYLTEAITPKIRKKL